MCLISLGMCSFL
ncbi:hypothetical protein VCHC50A2_1973, partial [Vibrio cholerae HC-50A2]